MGCNLILFDIGDSDHYDLYKKIVEKEVGMDNIFFPARNYIKSGVDKSDVDIYKLVEVIEENSIQLENIVFVRLSLYSKTGLRKLNQYETIGSAQIRNSSIRFHTEKKYNYQAKVLIINKNIDTNEIEKIDYFDLPIKQQTFDARCLFEK